MSFKLFALVCSQQLSHFVDWCGEPWQPCLLQEPNNLSEEGNPEITVPSSSHNVSNRASTQKCKVHCARAGVEYVPWGDYYQGNDYVQDGS
jgi:hypothetical protein